MAMRGGTYNRGTQSQVQRGGGHTRRDSNRKEAARTKNQTMTENQIVGFLGRKIWQAMNDEDGDISDNRKENFNYYIGEEYGSEREGYSKHVTRETLETIEWVLPSVLRVFLSGDKIVTFEPVGPEDEDAADQETDVANYFIMQANNRGQGGFLPLHHWMKDALMYPNGYLKIHMDEREETDVGTVTGLNEVGVQMLVDDPNVTILEQRTRTETLATPTGGVPIEVIDLKIRTTRKVKELRLDAVPPDECLVDNDCTTLNLDEADFVCHRVRKTFTQLVQEGYDPEELDQVGIGQDYQWNDERVNRLFYEDEDPDAEDEDDPSMRTFWVHECYAWFDYNGDGIGEQRRVVLIGDKVFDNEETNYQPLIALSSILMQHKHTGLSYVDIMKDLQVLLSTLTRQLLDNVYKINVGRTVFSEDALTTDGSTMEALLNRQAEYIPVRGLAANAFASEPIHSLVGEILPIIQHFTEQTATRTGVTPESSIDANSLQEVRQEVFTNALDRASQRIEMLVRIFAETGFRQAMLKVHQLLRSHWDVQRAVKLRGEWINVDPQGWRNRADTKVNVGLGFHTKQQQLGLLVQMLSMQKEAAMEGMADHRKIYRTLEKLVNAAGLGDVRQHFIDPDSPEFQPPEPQPDPNTILAQAQAQALQADSQIKAQKNQMDGQIAVQKMQADAAAKQMDLETKRIDQQIKLRELTLKETELEQEGILKEGELDAKIRNLLADTQLKEAQADKAMAEAASTAVEASETYTEAVDIVSKSAEENEIHADAVLEPGGLRDDDEG